MVVRYPSWYTPPCLPGYIYGVHSLPVALGVPEMVYLAVMLLHRFTLLVRRLKRRGLPGQKGAFFTLRIKPSRPGNGPNVVKKPATESTPAQGTSECQDPSSSDLKPPLKVRTRLFTPAFSSQIIGDLPGFLASPA